MSPAVPDVAIAATIPLGRPLGDRGPVWRLPLGDILFDRAWGDRAPCAADPDGTRFAGPPPGNPAATLPR